MRRLFQFRLRTLFVLTAIAALLAWILPPQIEKYREHRARLERERLAAEIDRLILARLARTGLRIDYVDVEYVPDLAQFKWVMPEKDAQKGSDEGSTDNETGREESESRR